MCTQDCTRGPLLLFFFFLIRDRVCVALPFVTASSSTPSKDEVVAEPFQAAATTFVINPPYRCRRLFRRWRHSTGLRQADARSASAPPAVLTRTSPPMFLKEDVVATPDLSATLAATCAVATLS